MGESVVEGTILTWLKKEGDAVEVDDSLVEVSTDKVDTEIPSPVAGTLTKILVQEGETVDVGTPLCEIDEATAEAKPEPVGAEAKPEPVGAGAAPAAEAKAEPAAKEEAPPAAREPEEEPEPQAAPTPQPAAPARRAVERPAASAAPARAAGAEQTGQVISPLVRRLAREHNVDPSQIRGTGAGGRVTKQDVLAYTERGRPDGQPVAPARVSPPAAREVAGERTSSEALSHIRKRIAEHMTHSLRTSARAWNVIEVDMEAIARLREQVNPEFRRREGFSLTFLPFIARAVCDALTSHPLVNASVSDDVSQVTYHNYVNLGIAVATDYGLIVPVVRGAEVLTVVGLARTIRELADKARDKKLNPDDVGGSTFAITNPGPFGSYVSLPVINQPNVAILSTEVVEKRVVVVDDMIAIRHRMFLSMSWDHRLLDGSDAMRFLQTLKENLETWDFSHDLA